MEKYYFIDESGDAEFFGKRGKKLWEYEGWHPVLIIGLVEMNNRKQLRNDVKEFHEKILSDVYYSGICSLNKENHFFHARSDHSDVRSAFFQFLRIRNDFTCYFSIIEKDPLMFIQKFNKKPMRFYFYAVEKLLELPAFSHLDNHTFYLSRRNKTTHSDFDRVIKSALNKEMHYDRLLYSADIVKSSEYPELCVIDYMLWAVQRWIMKGEARFLKAVSDKIMGIADSHNYLNKEGTKTIITIEELLSIK